MMFNRKRKESAPVQEAGAKSYYVSMDTIDGKREEWPDVELVWIYDGGMVSIRATDGDVTLVPVREIVEINMTPNTGAPDETE